MKKPNILWILAEDIGCHQGCFGDQNAITPNLDNFAKDAIRYSDAYSVAPVCSAARTSLILGCQGSSYGVGQHRSMARRPDFLKVFPYYLKEQGYYTAIGKTDFNFALTDEEEFCDYIPGRLDDDTAETAQRIRNTYQKRAEGQPFFMMHTILCTHQSQYGYTDDKYKHRESMPRLKESEYQDRESLSVPDYHYDSGAAREIWAQYHEKMTTMDKMFGEVIEQLKVDGLYDDTIIFFFGDNGHGIPSGKCSLWDEGVHVPLMVKFPKNEQIHISNVIQDQYGSKCDTKVSFLDFAPTIFELANIEIPNHFQGKSLLAKTEQDYVMCCGDRVGENVEGNRVIRDQEYLYIRSFCATKNYSLNSYSVAFSSWFSAESARISNEQDYSENRKDWFCEYARDQKLLFDLNQDKAQLHNIVLECPEKAIELEEKLFQEIVIKRDSVFIPESMLIGFVKEKGVTAFEVINDDTYYPLDTLVELERYGLKECNISEAMATTNTVVKYQLLRLFRDDIGVDELKNALYDSNETLSVYAAYLLLDRKQLVEEAGDRISEIIKTTSNASLLIFVVDLLKEIKEKASFIFEELLNRVELQDISEDTRYISSLRDSVCLLQKRLHSNRKLTFYNASWSQAVDHEIELYIQELENSKKEGNEHV